jgi:hypothetical protein
MQTLPSLYSHQDRSHSNSCDKGYPPLSLCQWRRWLLLPAPAAVLCTGRPCSMLPCLSR